VNPAYALAALASVMYGSADFLGGRAACRASALTVTFVSGAAGLASLGAAMLFLHGAARPLDFAWGAAAGLSGGIGIALLYRAFAIGPVSLAAPVISLAALAVPVLASVLLGERPSALALVGIALAACAFPLLSATGEAGVAGSEAVPPRRAVFVALAAGALVGGFLVLMGRVSRGAGLGPLLAARLVTVLLFGALVALRRESLWPATAARSTLVAGVLDSFANVLYFVAVHRGTLAMVGTIISLSPATTVLLARTVLSERWTVPQRAGLAFAAAAIVCVSLG